MTNQCTYCGDGSIEIDYGPEIKKDKAGIKMTYTKYICNECGAEFSSEETNITVTKLIKEGRVRVRISIAGRVLALGEELFDYYLQGDDGYFYFIMISQGHGDPESDFILMAEREYDLIMKIHEKFGEMAESIIEEISNIMIKNGIEVKEIYKTKEVTKKDDGKDRNHGRLGFLRRFRRV